MRDRHPERESISQATGSFENIGRERFLVLSKRGETPSLRPSHLTPETKSPHLRHTHKEEEHKDIGREVKNPRLLPTRGKGR